MPRRELIDVYLVSESDPIRFDITSGQAEVNQSGALLVRVGSGDSAETYSYAPRTWLRTHSFFEGTDESAEQV